MKTGLLIAALLAASPTMEELLATYAKTHAVAFDRLKSVELSDTQTRVTQLGAKGKPFQAQLEVLRKRQGEVSDLLVKAFELRKQGQSEKRVALVEAGLKALLDADVRAVALVADVKQLNEKLTAAGAPLIAPQPPRDPNARD